MANDETTEMADIDRILKEKGKGSKKKYLVSWMDGAEPEWVDATHLDGTEALDDWENAEDEIPEEHDHPDQVAAKCAQLATWLGEAKRPVYLLGAGISASVLPTFRGKGGLWTKNATTVKKTSASSSSSSSSSSSHLPSPTVAHEALVALEKVTFV